eukprot:352399-Chlamydomonas_euryale.AAC.3
MARTSRCWVATTLTTWRQKSAGLCREALAQAQTSAAIWAAINAAHFPRKSCAPASHRHTILVWEFACT